MCNQVDVVIVVEVQNCQNKHIDSHQQEQMAVRYSGVKKQTQVVQRHPRGEF